jgi:hypothetical protein
MKLVAMLAFLLSPLPPVALYLAGGSLSTMEPLYLVAQVCGIAAFSYFIGQFLLAGKPFGLGSLLGAKDHQRLHVALAALGIFTSHAHWYVKAVVFGMPYEPFVIAGHVAMALFSVASLAALVLISPLAIAKPFSRLRQALAGIGLDWKRARAVHQAVALGALALAFHVLSAWSTQMSWYAFAWMAAYLLASLAAFVAYRIRGRK